MLKYSEFRKKLNIQPLSDNDNNQAYLTHYLQNIDSEAASYFEEEATEYFRKFDIRFRQGKQEKFNFNWDIPFPTQDKYRFKFIDLFAGIGGIRIAYQDLGGKCVYSSEYDKFAKLTYEANFGEVPFGDITKIDEKSIPDHDILLAGFPCQPFSIAGVSKKNALGRKHGFLDETQGTLFFDIVRIIDHKRPRAFMLENVKNLVSHDNGNTFRVIQKAIKVLGYSFNFRVLDSKHFVPQHRERTIMVGFRKDLYGEDVQFAFPEMPEPSRSFREILQPDPLPKYTLTSHLWSYLQNYAEKHKAKGNGFGFGLTNLDGISRTLSARYYKDGAEILIPQKGKPPRRLTPKECASLQGFPEKFLIPVSDNQAYRQFGNSVTVPLIQFVGNSIVNKLLSIYEPDESEIASGRQRMSKSVH
jgi:DNA (cytosine-5)-methyltransferase 1